MISIGLREKTSPPLPYVASLFYFASVHKLEPVTIIDPSFYNLDTRKLSLTMTTTKALVRNEDIVFITVPQTPGTPIVVLDTPQLYEKSMVTTQVVIDMARTPLHKGIQISIRSNYSIDTLSNVWEFPETPNFSVDVTMVWRGEGLLLMWKPPKPHELQFSLVFAPRGGDGSLPLRPLPVEGTQGNCIMIDPPPTEKGDHTIIIEQKTSLTLPGKVCGLSTKKPSFFPFTMHKPEQALTIFHAPSTAIQQHYRCGVGQRKFWEDALKRLLVQ